MPHHDGSLAHDGADRYLVPKVTPQIAGRQASLHANTNFAAVSVFAGCNTFFETI